MVFHGTPPATPLTLVGCVINGDTIGTITRMEGPEYSIIPDEFIIKQNYPNPFNSTTRFEYSLFQEGRLKIYITDSLGERITVLLDDNKSPGEYSENINFENYGGNISSGTYYLTFIFNDKQKTIKMIYLK